MCAKLHFMHLQSADRSFFRLVGQAAFSNPFSEERDELDREVARVTGDVPDLIAAVTERVSTRLLRVEVEGRIDLSHYETGDRSLLRHAILFDAFHQFIPQLDRFIHEEEPATSIRVPFAEELRGLLKEMAATEAKLDKLKAAYAKAKAKL